MLPAQVWPPAGLSAPLACGKVPVIMQAPLCVRRCGACLLLFATLLTPSLIQAGDTLTRDFQRPPAAARPWVYWFWLNSNITREGITADLEAMRRAGIGGALIMEVDQGAPVGPVPFMSRVWQELFQFAVTEAHRLGLELNMNNDAGWNGSGGPWIKPEQSMQKLVWSETQVEGPRAFDGPLPPPETVAGYYRDIVVLAFPTPGAFRIDNLKAKACFESAYVGPVALTNLPPDQVIDPQREVNLTAQLQPGGRLAWSVPPGRWTIMRLGHTSTGVENAPAPASGRGLECDKLSKEGIEANFAGMMGPLIRNAGKHAGRALAATHIDSWENGAQNWTARMREEFQTRRGYDPLPFLPAVSGRVVGSHDQAERFLWDLRQTISELVLENYAGHLRTLAQRHGLRLSIEAYGGPCDDLPYAGRADEPMCEFWIGGSAFNTVKGMASAAHTYGKPILGAEAFTAADQEKWLEHPASIKSLGDRAFCDGVNRFVFHRYALQPWRDRRPGMTMGPWGLHYERTQTWWEWSRPWHEYLARCQFLLRQGRFVADLCFLNPEASPQDFPGHDTPGYDYDHGAAEMVLQRMSVRDGRLVLPDGMSYRLLVLPDVPTMTPALLRKIRDLVSAGATVLGSAPQRSPSLSHYPQCDDEVRSLARELWGGAGAASAGGLPGRTFGQGRVISGMAPEKTLASLGVPPDFTSRPHLRFIHRRTDEMDFYFVANPKAQSLEALATFRVTGKRPELWWPDSGRIEPAPAWESHEGTTTMPLRLEPSGSVFVVFRPNSTPADPIVALTRDGQALLPPPALAPKLRIERAVYGELDRPERTRDVRAQVQRIADRGDESFQVRQLAQDGDPAEGAMKTVRIEYTVGDRHMTVTGQDPDVVGLPEFAPRMEIKSATYGVLDDPKRTRDVRAKLQKLVDAGRTAFTVAEMAAGDDPAFLVVKTLVVEYTVDGRPATLRGTDPENLVLAQAPVAPMPRVAELVARGPDKVRLLAWESGRYEARTAAGRVRQFEVGNLPTPITLRGPWQVRFAPGWGAPATATFPDLIDWSKHPESGIKYYSGSARYERDMMIPADWLGGERRVRLDLGTVAVMARIRLNGRDLGTLWKPPYEVDLTRAAKPGANRLEISVVNLWPNRLIGDEQLPEDSERNADGTLKSWPAWLQEGKPSPSGRFTFTSWRLWKKDSPLQPSGLIGPVTLRPAVEVTALAR